jgi:CHAT domain-containing protein
MSEAELKTLTRSSRQKLSRLYELALKKPIGALLPQKRVLIISPDGALRLLPFEAMYDAKNKRYLIEEKAIRYIPSGKELLRLYKYAKSPSKARAALATIFADPDFNAQKGSASSSPEEEVAITPNTSRSGIVRSLFKMRFPPLPGTKAEAKSIENTLKKSVALREYEKDRATEANLLHIKNPKILHIATHGFFINDPSIPNPMLKSGLALAGANASLIRGRSEGIVTALKLSGLELEGTDLVVLSACNTGVVDLNSTDTVSGLSKAFIQAGAKDIVMSLWSVNDQATKDLMSGFYRQMQKHESYEQALREAKLKMIRQGMHPFFWAPFILSGL